MKANKLILVLVSTLIQSLASKAPQMLPKREPSKPFISGDGFRSMANHVFDETDWTLQGLEIEDGDIIFVKSDKMDDFFSNVHPTISASYILITHNSDASCPGEFIKYIDDPKIIKWFGQNPSISGHQKFSAIPIGIANRYISTHGNLDNFMNFYGHTAEKEWCVAINFSQGPYLEERSFVYHKFVHEDYCKELYADQHFTYLLNMSRAHFVLSPRGNGLDCHRTWEALIVNTIPIVKSSPLDEIFSDLPIIIVDDWNIINQQFLDNALTNIKNNNTLSWGKKLEYEFWEEIILSLQRNYRAESTKKI